MTTPEEDPRSDLVDDDTVLSERTPAEREAARARRERRRERRRKHQQRQRRRRRAVVAASVLLLVVAIVLVWFRWTFAGLDRIPVTTAGGGSPGTTILLVGSDPGAHDEAAGGVTWPQDLGHSDLVMLVHVPEDRSALYAVSVPGTARLPGVGRSVTEAAGDDPAAYLRTITDATGVEVDQLAVLDLNGVREAVDRVGGVTVNVTAPGCGEPAGRTRVDGQDALELVRLRPCLPRGDLDRVVRQQQLFRALLGAVVDGRTLANPFTLNRIAKSTFDHLAVDEDWGRLDMLGLGWSLRGINPRSTTFLTAPTTSRGKGDDATLVLDEGRAAELWEALRRDRLGEYVALNRDVVTAG